MIGEFRPVEGRGSLNFRFADPSDTIPKACAVARESQDQPFMSAVGALDGQLEANQEKPDRGPQRLRRC